MSDQYILQMVLFILGVTHSHDHGERVGGRAEIPEHIHTLHMGNSSYPLNTSAPTNIPCISVPCSIMFSVGGKGMSGPWLATCAIWQQTKCSITALVIMTYSHVNIQPIGK